MGCCGISLQCLGIEYTRRKRDRILLTLGWAGFVFLWLFKWRGHHQAFETIIGATSFGFLVLIVASVCVWRREKQLGRIAAIPDKPKEGQPLDWKFKARLCGRRTAVVWAYTWNDILPPLCSFGALGLVVSAMITSISDIGANRDGSMTIIEKGMWCGSLLFVVATWVVIAGLMLFFKPPNTRMRTVGWQVCCALTIAMFYAGAVSGWAGGAGMLTGSLIANYIKFFSDAQAFAWVSVGILFVICCLVPVVCCKLFVCKSSKVVGFNAEWNARGKLVAIPVADNTQDGYVSLFEFPLDDMEPHTMGLILKGVVVDVGGAAAENLKCGCTCKPESKATVFQREFDNPINPLFADALSAGRIIAAKGVLAQGGEVNGLHEGKNMLMHAIDGGSMECFQVLLSERRLDINRVLPPTGASDDGISALHYAVQAGKLEFVKALLSHPGINYRVATSKHRHTAFRQAVERCQFDIVQLFLALPKPKKSVKVLLQAASADGSGMNEVLTKVLRRGAGPPLNTASAVLKSMQALGVGIDAKVVTRAQRLGVALA